MKLSQLKQVLLSLEQVDFQLEDGSFVPAHFHITELGVISKSYIDCGGTIRHDQIINFQLWYAEDMEHRLQPQKLLSIIRLAEEKLGLEDADIEVEYQGNTIGKYGLAFNGQVFLLQNKMTACLAEEACGVPVQKQHRPLAALRKQSECCAPGTAGCK